MKNLFDLTGKVCLVTGGNSGIGIGMAEGLAMHGASVVIWGTNAEKNAAAAARLEAQGGEVRSAIVDVSDEAAVAAGVQAILSEFGRLDQAIANSGIGIARKDLFEITAEDFRRMESVNVHGVLFTLRELRGTWFRGTRKANPAARWSPSPLPPRSMARRATSIMARPRARSSRWCARWRSSWPPRASPSTASARAGHDRA